MDIETIHARLMTASTPEDFFGPPHAAPDETRKAITKRFRDVVLVVHPDKYTKDKPKRRALAQAAFVKLGMLKNDALAKLAHGTYGNKHATVPKPPAPRTAPTVVKVRDRTFTIKEHLCKGDISDLYVCEFIDKHKTPMHAVLKLAANASCNDLLETEASVLKDLYPEAQDDTGNFRYLPKLYDSFQIRGPGGLRRANVLKRLDNTVSFAEILTAYPKGLDFRDAVWMYKRLLTAVGEAAHRGYVHGAVLPPHVLVYPETHGGRLIDWCYAVKPGMPVRAISPAWRAYYAPEVLDKQPASTQTDVYMATKCALALVGGDVATNAMPATVPIQFQRFLTSVLAKNPVMRPTAWQLWDDLNDLLSRIVGKRVFRPFSMPEKRD